MSFITLPLLPIILPPCASHSRYILHLHAWSAFIRHLLQPKSTFTRIHCVCLLWHFRLIDFCWCFNSKFILNLLSWLDNFVLLLVFLSKTEGSRPCQFFNIFNTVILASKHSCIRSCRTNSYLLSTIDQVETSDYFLIAFKSTSNMRYMP